MAEKLCKHLVKLKPQSSAINYCEECVKTNDKWVHLRVCQDCGATLCCDSSKNKHASKHYEETGHPVVISNLPKPWSQFAWCYEDKLKKVLR